MCADAPPTHLRHIHAQRLCQLLLGRHLGVLLFPKRCLQPGQLLGRELLAARALAATTAAGAGARRRSGGGRGVGGAAGGFAAAAAGRRGLGLQGRQVGRVAWLRVGLMRCTAQLLSSRDTVRLRWDGAWQHGRRHAVYSAVQ